MSSIKYATALLLIFALSCKPASKEDTNTQDEPIGVDEPIHIPTEDGGVQVKATNLEYDLSVPTNQSVAGPNTIKSMRRQAYSILENRLKAGGEVAAILDIGTFFYEFIVKGSKVSEVGQLDNKWVDFKSDWTYDYGFNREVQGGGRFHYNPDNQVLLMIDNDQTIKPQEFNAKHAGNTLVLVGTPTYKDNNMQIKLGKVILNNE
jgi:hypothetical protein